MSFLNNFKDMVVLVTGGTKGIGLSVVELFSQAGATVYSTYLWGNNVNDLKERFSSYDNKPIFLRADVSDAEDTDKLIEKIKLESGRLDVFISNAAFASRFKERYSERDFINSIQYSAMPLFKYMDCMRKIFSRYPRYIVSLSSNGTDHYYEGYDYVAVSKSILEILTKYIGCREKININCVSPGLVDTEAFQSMFGEKMRTFMKTYAPAQWVEPIEIAKVIFSLCSGLMDAVSGQVIKVNKGQLFSDNSFTMYEVIKDAVK